MDRLIFLANRYVETYTGIKKADLDAEVAKLEILRTGDRPDIARWWWDDSGMHVVVRGLHSKRSRKGRGQSISRYYFMVDEFDPFTGGKKHAATLASPFWPRAHRQQRAAASATAWRRWFTLNKLMEALAVNRLLPGQAQQVDVHHSFLSGFVHPSKRGYQAIHGRNYPDRMGSYDHFASEILLLYVIVIAAAELEIYGRMAHRVPRLGLSHWPDVEAEVAAARIDSAYFWFLGGEPTMYDRIASVHTPRGNARLRWGRPRMDPASVPNSAVRYYADPLERLVKLHQTSREMATGLAYQSSFERPDAYRR